MDKMKDSGILKNSKYSNTVYRSKDKIIDNYLRPQSAKRVLK